jgi:hypothetical protein
MHTHYLTNKKNNLGNKILLLITSFQIITLKKLFEVQVPQSDKIIAPALIIKTIKKANSFYYKLFVKQPVRYKNTFFFTISGSAIFCNLSLIMRHMRRPPTPAYARLQPTSQTNFINNIKLQKQL